MVSEAQKRSRDKWDASNMATIGCKIKKETADKFRQACEKNGAKPNAVLKNLVMDYIAQNTEDV